MVNVNHSWWMGELCGLVITCAIWHIMMKAHRLRLEIFDLENKMSGKLQKRIHEHLQKYFKMFK
jgi:hypothetical protein